MPRDDLDFLLDDNVVEAFREQEKLDRLRYWLYRKQKAVESKTKVKGAPRGMSKILAAIEELPFFAALDGWRGFARRWDIDPKFEFYARTESQAAEYERWLDSVAVPIVLKPVKSTKAPASQVERIEVYPEPSN